MNDLRIIETPEQSEATADFLLTTAKAHTGLDAVEVSVNQSTGFSVTARQGDVETIEHVDECEFAITAYVGQAKGTAQTNDASETGLIKAIEAAYDIASRTSSDPCNGIALDTQMAKKWKDIPLEFDWDISIHEATQMAIDCETKALADSRISQSDGASIESYKSIRSYANSHGFSGTFSKTRHSSSIGLIAEGEKGMQQDYGYSVVRDANDLMSSDEVANQAIERTSSRLNARKVKTTQVPVIFDTRVASSLIHHYLGAISGGNLFRKMSFLTDSIGKRVFPDWFNANQDPSIAKGLASIPFDYEGLPVKEKPLIQDGKVCEYLLSLYSARQLDLEPNGHSAGEYNIKVQSSGATLEQLISDIDEGFLVTHLMGSGVDLTRGDYSRGAGGFWIEKGKIAYPVEEVTVAGQLPEIFENIAAVTDDFNPNSHIHCGAIYLPMMTVAGE